MLSSQQTSLPEYEKVRDRMKTGDVIAFSGNEFLHQLVKLGTFSKYSHLALVHTNPLNGDVLIIESHIDTRLADVKTGKAGRGIQMQLLSKRLELFNGAAWWAPLKNSLSAEGMLAMQEWLRETHGNKIQYDFAGAIGAGFDVLDELGLTNTPDLSTQFCSEMVSAALQMAGVVDKSINPSEQTPADVMGFDCLETPIIIKKG